MAWGGRKFDAIVIGGDHNGLAAAACLGRASLRVLLLEAGDRLGGAAVTAEILPDYEMSTMAHLVEALPRHIERHLKLSKHGLRLAARDLPTVALDRDGGHLVLPRNRKDVAALAGTRPADAAAWRVFDARMKAHVALIAPLLFDDTASIQPSLRRLVWRAEWRAAGTLADLLHLLPQSIGDLLDAEFEYPLLKGALALDAVLGGVDGPYAPGTMLRYLHRLALRGLGRGYSIPAGGLGAVTDALAAAVAAQRGEIRTGARVSRLLVERGAIAGVETADGTVIVAPLVVSSLGRRATMLDLLGAAHIETAQLRRLPVAAPAGSVAKVNLALDGLPDFRGLSSVLCGARLLIAPALEDVDRAATLCAQGDIAAEPVMEITIPSIADPALAPAGHHVMSVLLPFMPHDIEGGWPARREAVLQSVIRTIAQYAPDFADRVIAGDLLTPPDIEAKSGIPGGGLGPAERLCLDAGAARQATPVPGLWLCGPGSHPGDGAIGLAGCSAATAIVAERRAR